MIIVVMFIVTVSNCARHQQGIDYLGQVNESLSGKPCHLWSSNDMQYSFPFKTSAEAGNYCRNPTGESRPYCLIDVDGTKEECDIEYCGKWLTSVC